MPCDCQGLERSRAELFWVLQGYSGTIIKISDLLDLGIFHRGHIGYRRKALDEGYLMVYAIMGECPKRLLVIGTLGY